MSAAHTPGPVRLSKGNPKRIVSVCRAHPSDRRAVPLTIAVCETEGDASRIVQCVNAHDELLAMVTRIAEAEFGFGCGGGWPTEVEVRAVIAKATGSAA